MNKVDIAWVVTTALTNPNLLARYGVAKLANPITKLVPKSMRPLTVSGTTVSQIKPPRHQRYNQPCTKSYCGSCKNILNQNVSGFLGKKLFDASFCLFG
jgi:hypothetical protein